MPVAHQKRFSRTRQSRKFVTIACSARSVGIRRLAVVKYSKSAGWLDGSASVEDVVNSAILSAATIDRRPNDYSQSHSFSCEFSERYASRYLAHLTVFAFRIAVGTGVSTRRGLSRLNATSTICPLQRTRYNERVGPRLSAAYDKSTTDGDSKR